MQETTKNKQGQKQNLGQEKLTRRDIGRAAQSVRQPARSKSPKLGIVTLTIGLT